MTTCENCGNEIREGSRHEPRQPWLLQKGNSPKMLMRGCQIMREMLGGGEQSSGFTNNRKPI